MPGNRIITALIAVIVVAIVAGSIELYEYDHSLKANKMINPVTSMDNLTSLLDGYYDPGAIQTFGANNSSILISGTGLYNKATDFSLPVLEQINSLSTIGVNESAIANRYFWQGGVFDTVWNGSSWLISGQITSGNNVSGALIALKAGVVQNFTSEISKYFRDGGAWFDNWNGTGWLVGGNCDNKASLIAFYHGKFFNYTPLLGNVSNGSWIQLLVWNGSSWEISGHGVFGFLKGNRFTNLLDDTIFKNSGVFAADFQAGSWFIGGGPPAGVQKITGSSITATLIPGGDFSRYVNAVVPYAGGFLIGGEGMLKPSNIAPELLYVHSDLSTGSVQNESGFLPLSFQDGQIQYMANVNFRSQIGVLIAGEGSYNETSG